VLHRYRTKELSQSAVTETYRLFPSLERKSLDEEVVPVAGKGGCERRDQAGEPPLDPNQYASLASPGAILRLPSWRLGRLEICRFHRPTWLRGTYNSLAQTPNLVSQPRDNRYSYSAGC